MRKVWHVALNEFVNTILSKGFLIAVIMTPVFVLGSIVVQTFLQTRVDTDERRLAVVDRTGRLFSALAAAAAERDKKIFEGEGASRRQLAPKFTPVEVAQTETPAALSKRVRRGDFFAFILIPEGALSTSAETTLDYYTDTPTYTDLWIWTHKVLRERAIRLRLEAAGINAETVRRLGEGPLLRRLALTDAETGAEVNMGATFGVPAAAMFLVFLIIFMSAPMLLHSVIEEKQNRIWEVLVSSVTPFELLLGKLLGITLVSMSLSLVFLGGAISLAEVLEVTEHLKPSLFAWFLLFQVMGLLIYGSIFSAIGAVCTEIRDAQSLMMPAMLLIIIPMFGWVAVLRAPASAFARGLSLFPPATPMLMLLRVALPPGPAAWEIVLSLVLTSAFALACVWGAGKIFRAGILAQGQTPTWRRMASWLIEK